MNTKYNINTLYKTINWLKNHKKKITNNNEFMWYFSMNPNLKFWLFKQNIIKFYIYLNRDIWYNIVYIVLYVSDLNKSPNIRRGNVIFWLITDSDLSSKLYPWKILSHVWSKLFFHWFFLINRGIICAQLTL